MGCASSSDATSRDSHQGSTKEGPGAGERVGSRAHHFDICQDQFQSIHDVVDGLRSQGLESVRLTFAVDLTTSNLWTGAISFNGHNLHSVEMDSNPYKQAMSVVAQTLGAFVEGRGISLYGFGAHVTSSAGLVDFEKEGKPLQSLEHVLQAYDSVIPELQFGKGTNYAPAVRKALEKSRTCKGFSVLVIITDGQVSREFEDDSVLAMREASNHGMSILLVGVGDGPWTEMPRFASLLKGCEFANFQFVNWTELSGAMQHATDEARDAALAISLLKHMPDQYVAARKQHTVSRDASKAVQHVHVFAPFGSPDAAKPLKEQSGFGHAIARNPLFAELNTAED